jgi:hypothetical protein
MPHTKKFKNIMVLSWNRTENFINGNQGNSVRKAKYKF